MYIDYDPALIDISQPQFIFSYLFIYSDFCLGLWDVDVCCQLACFCHLDVFNAWLRTKISSGK